MCISIYNKAVESDILHLQTMPVQSDKRNNMGINTDVAQLQEWIVLRRVFHVLPCITKTYPLVQNIWKLV